jgi:carbon-monoxide dehydrogenase large subunit
MLPSMLLDGEATGTPLVPLARGDVRFVGDPVVLIVARDRYLAEDAAELVELDYDPLPPVVDLTAAAADDAPRVHEERPSNLQTAIVVPMSDDARTAFDAAPHHVEATLVQHRHSANPLECRAVVSTFDRVAGTLDVHVSSQNPHEARQVFARVTGVPEHLVRVRIGDVGGGFGLKHAMGREEQVVVLASYVLGTTVRWAEDRREHLVASSHARHEEVRVTMAVADDLSIVGVDVDHIDDIGAYPVGGSAGALVGMLFSGPYRVGAVGWSSRQVWTNTCGKAAYRGPWMMETTAREEMVEHVARELGVDPLAFRRANVLLRADQPYTAPTGMPIDLVTPAETLDAAADAIGYKAFRAEQAAAREQGRYLGIGFGLYVEPQFAMFAGANEPAHVRLLPNGHVDVYLGSGAHGQGLETTTSQLVAEHLGVAVDDVAVHQGDTANTPFGPGTGGSRSGPMLGAAVQEASAQLREKVVAIAAHLLEASPDDLDVVEGVVAVRGTPGTSITIRQVAETVYQGKAPLPRELDRTLEVMHRYEPPGLAWSNACHVATVEVDPVTGKVAFLRYVVAEDCGKMINPQIVDGQVHGGVAQGIGGVLYEHNVYDEAGTPLTSTFLDYLLPTAHEIPTIESIHLESPGITTGSYKGVGEGGAIGAPATVFNAVADALAPLGVQLFEQPLTPERVVAAVRAATG